MELRLIDNANLDLVELADDGNIGRLTPHCKIHRAMNKMTADGIWRCIASYKVLNYKTGHIKENDCLAGCEWR